jgi:hypothetical protein
MRRARKEFLRCSTRVFLTSFDVRGWKMLISLAQLMLFVAQASRRLFCLASKAHKPAGETPALLACDRKLRFPGKIEFHE